MVFAFTNFAILLVVSIIHIYWGLGGHWGLRESLPERNDIAAFQPGRVATLVVAVIFGGIALFYLYKAGQFSLVDSFIPNWLSNYGLWLLAAVFLLRAIGDFHYVGFTKRIRNSRFAELDTKFYSPLCLLLSANTLLLISFLSKS
jgi:protein-S-isoprenylcysteine O-methyltransferase Ste14